jgi:hypothetical protein
MDPFIQLLSVAKPKKSSRLSFPVLVPPEWKGELSRVWLWRQRFVEDALQMKYVPV